MFDKGSLTVGRFRGAPIRVHWSALVAVLVFSGFSFDPVAWLAVAAMIILHEIGHALLVRYFGHEVLEVQVHGFGGHCAWSGDPSRAEQAAIAWGGVLAQAALLLVALPFRFIVPPSAPILGTVLAVFTSTNLYSIIFNLMPIPPLDGSKAWELLPIWASSRAELRDYLRRRDADRSAKSRARAAEKKRDAERRARQKTEAELRDLESVDDEDAPLPDSLKEALDRLVGEAVKDRNEKDKKPKG
ncbi:MAG: hypothetical protein U0359_09070 [Byssovorax sp.]